MIFTIEKREVDIRNIYINPVYKVISKKILNPISTKISPIPNGFFIIFPMASIEIQSINPMIRAVCGIEFSISKVTKKKTTENIKNVFTNIWGTPLYILSKYEKEKKNINTRYKIDGNEKKYILPKPIPRSISDIG